MTKEQTNSWDWEKEFHIMINMESNDPGVDGIYIDEKLCKNFISKTLSQEKEKWIEEINTELENILKEILKDDSVIKQNIKNQFQQKIINLLQK